VPRYFGSDEKCCFDDDELRPSVGPIVVDTGIIPLDPFGRMVGSISGRSGIHWLEVVRDTLDGQRLDFPGLRSSTPTLLRVRASGKAPSVVGRPLSPGPSVGRRTV
jgi:hypothetical protein